jgi:hypothetical protein
MLVIRLAGGEANCLVRGIARLDTALLGCCNASNLKGG